VLAVASAAGVRAALDPVLHTEMPMLVFVAPAVMCAVFLGTGAGVFATMLSVLVGTYFFIEPVSAFGAVELSDRVRIAVFLAQNLIIVGLIGAWRARRAKPRVEPSTQLLTTILDHLPEAVIAADRTGRIVAWNAGATRLLGYSADEVIGNTPPHVPPEGRASFEVRRARVLHGEHFDDIPIDRYRKDGSVAHCRVSVKPLREADDRIVGTIATLIEA
jgi:PAS domain S-box-containing protein